MSRPMNDLFWSVREELALFGGSVLLGIPAGVLFDSFRLLRRTVRHPTLAVAAEDILWLLGVAALLLCYASACGKGIFRAYYAAGCFIGFILYELTLGNPAMRLLEAVLRVVVYPFRRFYQWARLNCTKLIGRFVRIAKKKKCGTENTQNRLQETAKKVYNRNRHIKKGSSYGKDQTSGRSFADRRTLAYSGRTGACHQRVYDRLYHHAELDRGKETRTSGNRE